MTELFWIDERDVRVLHDRLLALHGGAAGILFLELNSYRFSANETDTAQAVLALAASMIDEVSYAAFLRANTIEALHRIHETK